MNIIKAQVFTVEMSFEELVGIKKIIGATSSSHRIEKMKLTKEQDEAVEKVFEKLDEYFVDEVAS